MGTSLLATLALAGCGTPPAKDFGGRWKPVNRFQDAPTEIPLAKTYTFYAAPMDGTLKTMLTRWAKDSGLQLSYQLEADFTLYKPVSQLKTTDIQDAVTKLNSIYVTQDVFVTADNSQIRVRSASAARAEATPLPEPVTTTPPAEAPATAK
ncbi:hypothetical protein SAMN05216570_0447 [Dyella sp. OK004]|uniref:toxin co-regulated pilus biosynthesis Q family protein n=1 Tax=Dyella sp. OK004 TaxID=1855292 RepID=UPI0008F36925|nr:toxin co-regulated pilus biosynthesis Q family protein [Dyella sp. OK004]SFR90041.1 hypothetical protein SAMN05216570_0447 [Dyella sp. OK004]